VSRTLSLGCAALAAMGLLLVAGHFLFPLPDALQFGGRAATLGGIGGLVLVRLAVAGLGVPRADRLLANLMLLAGTVALGLVACEFLLRFAFRDVTTTVDFQSYFTLRWRQEVRLNNMGFRDHDVAGAKPEHTYRIAVIGDSFTYGQGVETAARFTDRLETELNGSACPDVHYDVINLGQPGAETVDHLRILRTIALAQEPDFILLQWYENDVEGDDKSGRPRPMRLLPSAFLTKSLRAHSVLFYLLQSRWTGLQKSLGWLPSYESYMRERFQDPDSPDSRAATEDLAGFFTTSRAKGLPVGMILFPDPGGQRDLSFLHDRVLAQCAAAGVDYVSLQEQFAAVADPGSLWASRLDHHPGALAHQMATDLLLQTFAPVWHQDCAASQPSPAARP